MKKHLFRIIAVLSAAVLLAGCAASRLRLGAAAAGGVYNAFGTAMSAQNSTIEVKQTAGSAANLRLLAGGYLQLAVAQSDMAQDAYDGSGIFSHESTERSFSAVAALYEEAVQVVVRADSGITTLEELQGCTLSVGEEESGTEQNAGQVLAACGLNNRLVHTVNLNYTDAAARLADGTIDAMFVTAGLHADALEQLAETFNDVSQAHRLAAVAVDHESFKTSILDDLRLGNPADLYSYWAGARVQAIVEQKDATEAERAINEINTGMMAVPTARLDGW